MSGTTILVEEGDATNIIARDVRDEARETYANEANETYSNEANEKYHIVS